jgi:hypothetical protein
MFGGSAVAVMWSVERQIILVKFIIAVSGNAEYFSKVHYCS